MSKKISIINAGGIYAQTFLKNLRGFNHIALGDLFNNRRSVNKFLFPLNKFHYKTFIHFKCIFKYSNH